MLQSLSHRHRVVPDGDIASSFASPSPITATQERLNELRQLAKASFSSKGCELLEGVLASLQAQVAQLQAQVQDSQEQVKELQAQVQELQEKLSKNSRNSSKPPSSDGLNKPDKPAPKSLRRGGQRRSGGQPGHPGKTLEMVTDPDKVVEHEPPPNCECGRALGALEVAEKRQVFDVPPLRCEVTEHRVMRAQCACGKVHRGIFPEEVRAPVQYGPRALAIPTYLVNHHMLSVERTAQLMGDLFQLPMTDATVVAASQRAGRELKPVVQTIGESMLSSAILHADETGQRVNKKLHWMHVMTTPMLTWCARHAKRGKEALYDLGLLPKYIGTLVHDGWQPYWNLECKHALCNAHHLRELTFVHEQLGQPWALQMSELLVQANREVQAAQGPLDPERQTHYRDTYQSILAEGEKHNPPQPPSGRKGRTKQSKPTNLLARLRERATEVWRFMTDKDVPFTNNSAEQAIRMPKVKLKISGGFRSTEGADTFCTIRSYLASLQKQGANLLDSLTLTFQGKAPMPRLG